MKKKLKISSKMDFDAYHSHGGHILEMPKPHHRRFPSKSHKRRVMVRIISWKGVVFGASHYRVTISEEANPIWDKKENCWRSCWDDPSLSGIEDYLPDHDFLTFESALREARKFVKDNFTDDAHTVRMDCLSYEVPEYSPTEFQTATIMESD